MQRAAVVVCVLVLALLSLVPMARTLGESFVETAPDGARSVTLRWYDEAFVAGAPPAASPETTQQETPATRPVSARWRLLGNSVAIAAVAVAVAVLLGVPFALLVARTDAPLRGVLGSLYAAPLVLPPLLVAFAWTFVPGFTPPPILAGDEPPSWGGLLAVLRAGFLLGLCYFPLVVLFARRALAAVPASLEEAARLAGGPWRALRRVTLPLAAPGVLAGALFVFLFAVNDFSLVDYLNFVRPSSDRIGVYPFESFTAWSRTQGEAVATALGAPLALLGVVLVLAIKRLVGRGPRTSLAAGSGPAEPVGLGRWRWPAALAALAVLAVAVAVPVGGLLIQSASSEGLAAGDGPAWVRTFRNVWQHRVGPGTASNEFLWTLWFGGAAALLCLPLAFVLGHHAARTGRLRWFALAILPLAVPPIFLGAGYLKILNLPEFVLAGRNPFLDADSPRLGSILLLVAKYVPFAIAALWAAFLEIDPRLEEAAASAGVRPLDRVLGVLLPLAKPALALAFVLVFVLVLREIDTNVLLSSDTLMRRIYTMVHVQRDREVAALCILLIAIEALAFVLLAILVGKPATRAARSQPAAGR